MTTETPDNWIERQPQDCPPNPDDLCIVCGKLDCVCREVENENEIIKRAVSFMAELNCSSWLDGDDVVTRNFKAKARQIWDDLSKLIYPN